MFPALELLHLVHQIFRHLAIGGPLPARDRDQAVLTPDDGVIARDRGGLATTLGAKGSVHASEHFFNLENKLFGFRIGSSLAYVAVD